MFDSLTHYVYKFWMCVEKLQKKNQMKYHGKLTTKKISFLFMAFNYAKGKGGFFYLFSRSVHHNQYDFLWTYLRKFLSNFFHATKKKQYSCNCWQRACDRPQQLYNLWSTGQNFCLIFFLQDFFFLVHFELIYFGSIVL